MVTSRLGGQLEEPPEMRVRDESGITAVELVVVLVIMGILAFVSYPLITNPLYVLNSKGAAEQVAGAVRQARQ